MVKVSTIFIAGLISSALLLGGCSDEKSTDKGSSLPSQITITEWQPRSTVMGEAFNVQPNGDSAIWFIASGIQASDNYEFWFGDKKIDALFIEPNKSGTVTIPKEFLISSGKFHIYLLAKADSKKIELGLFEVKEK